MRPELKGSEMNVSSTAGPQVHLRLPADNAYAAVLRMTATGLAARVEFTIDAIEDLRISVGEASALLLPLAAPSADLETRFTLEPGRIAVEMTAVVHDDVDVDRSSFAWQVLTTLTESCDVTRTGDELRIAFDVASCTSES